MPELVGLHVRVICGGESRVYWDKPTSVFGERLLVDRLSIYYGFYLVGYRTGISIRFAGSPICLFALVRGLASLCSPLPRFLPLFIPLLSHLFSAGARTGGLVHLMTSPLHMGKPGAMIEPQIWGSSLQLALFLIVTRVLVWKELRKNQLFISDRIN
jgi:hypothetical protein